MSGLLICAVLVAIGTSFGKTNEAEILDDLAISDDVIIV
jgi:hypothetical protein